MPSFSDKGFETIKNRLYLRAIKIMILYGYLQLDCILFAIYHKMTVWVFAISVWVSVITEYNWRIIFFRLELNTLTSEANMERYRCWYYVEKESTDFNHIIDHCVIFHEHQQLQIKVATVISPTLTNVQTKNFGIIPAEIKKTK